ncbi:hypothetical protein ACFLYT_01655, partial [Nanoarchaeota archaeon]
REELFSKVEKIKKRFSDKERSVLYNIEQVAVAYNRIVPHMKFNNYKAETLKHLDQAIETESTFAKTAESIQSTGGDPVKAMPLLSGMIFEQSSIDRLESMEERTAITKMNELIDIKKDVIGLHKDTKYLLKLYEKLSKFMRKSSEDMGHRETVRPVEVPKMTADELKAAYDAPAAKESEPAEVTR